MGNRNVAIRQFVDALLRSSMLDPSIIAAQRRWFIDVAMFGEPSPGAKQELREAVEKHLAPGEDAGKG